MTWFFGLTCLACGIVIGAAWGLDRKDSNH
jgi:DNA-directed RNA polymerase subunit N (RpoN/RPB10)